MNSDIKQHGSVTSKAKCGEWCHYVYSIIKNGKHIWGERESATLSDYIEYTLYLICKRFGEKWRLTKQHYYLTFIGSSVKSFLLTELHSLELVCRTASPVAGGCCRNFVFLFWGKHRGSMSSEALWDKDISQTLWPHASTLNCSG